MALNLEVPLEMCEYGMQSATTARTSTYQIINMDPGNYDGATYYYEIVATNANTTNGYAVSLRDVTGSTNKVSITVPANTTARTRLRSSSWTPTSGNRVYSTYIAATAAASNIIVYEARIVVVQSNATKTRIQIPLLNRNYSDNAAYTAQYVDNRNNASDGQSVSRYFPIFKYVAAAFSNVPASGFSFETAVASSNASATATVSLYNKTDSTIVASVTKSTTTPSVVTTSWSAGASNWHDGDDYEVRHKISNASYYSRIGNAYLYITISDLQSYEVYWKISKARTAGTGALINEYQRAQLNPDNYSNESIFFECTGYNNSSNNYLHLQDDGTNDSGTGGSNVSGADIAFNSGTKARQRTASTISLTNGNRYILDIDAAAANLELSAAFVVFQYIGTVSKSISDSGGGSDAIPIKNTFTLQEQKPATIRNILDLNIANGCEDGTWANDWTEVDIDGILTVSVDTDNEYSGTRCLKLAASASNSNYDYVETTDQAISPSVYYTVSARVKTGGSGQGLLGLLWSDSSHTFIDNNHTTFSNTTYQKVSFTQLMPANAAYVHVYFTVDIGTGARTFYGDEFQLEQNNSATDYQSPDETTTNASETLSKQEKEVKTFTETSSVSDTAALNVKTTVTEEVAYGLPEKEITITGSSTGSISNYVYPVTVTYEAGITNSDFGNIRFYVGETECSYFLKSKTDGVSANFDVKIPTIPASPGTTILSVLATSETTTTSSGDDTYTFFDDFTTSLSGSGKWETIGSGFSVSNGNLVSTGEDVGLESEESTSLNGFKLEFVINSDTLKTHRVGVRNTANTSSLWIYIATEYELLQFIKSGETTDSANYDCPMAIDTDHTLVLRRSGTDMYIDLNGSNKCYTNDFWNDSTDTVTFWEEATEHTTLYRYIKFSPYVYPEPSGSAGSWESSGGDAVSVVNPVDIFDSESTTEDARAIAYSANIDDASDEIGDNDSVAQVTNIFDLGSSKKAILITIDSEDALTNYVAELWLYITSGTGINCTDVADSNFEKLQPMDISGNALNFAKSVNGTQAIFDIEIPTLNAGTNYILLVREDETVTASTLDDLYLFADDFIGSDGSAPDVSKWTRTEGSPTIQNNTMRILAGEQIRGISIDNPFVMVRYRIYWNAFGGYGPRMWCPIKFNSDESANGTLWIAEGKPGQQDTWEHTAVHCGSFTSHHYVWYTGQWYNFTGRTDANNIYFDVPDGYTITQTCTLDDHASLGFDTWDSGNDLRIDYVKVQPFVANIPTIGGTAIVYLGSEIISKWFGTRDSGTVSEDVIGGEETTPVNVSDSGSDSELLAASIYALISQSSSGAETTSLKNTLRTKENPNLCYLNVATAGATNNNVDGFFYWHYNEGEDEYELLPLGTRDLTTLYDGMGTIKSIGFEFFTDEVFTEMHLKVSKEDYIVTATSGYLTPATGNKEYSITVPFMTDYEPQEPYPYLYLRVSVAFYDDVLDFLDWEYKMVSITPEVWKECILNFVTPPDTEFLYFEYKLIVSDSDSEEN